MMANQGVSLSDVKVARAHLVLLPQAQKFLDEHDIRAETAVDSAGAAQNWPPLAKQMSP